jgi:uncharacterized protein YecE (DUF72 family)
MRRTDLTWRIGTMGFAYAPWRGLFYPAGLPQSEQLAWYASHFDTIEIDSTFYVIPPTDRVKAWGDMVDDDFRFTTKMVRSVTHEGPPDERADLMRLYLDTLGKLGPKLEMVLLQFPPTFDASMAGSLLRLLDKVQTPIPLAVEVRHTSWARTSLPTELAARGVTLVANDYHDHAQRLVATAPRLYLRFIGVHDRYPAMNNEELDTEDRLTWWLDQVEKVAPPNARVVAAFNNNYAGYSVATAKRLKRLLGLPDGLRRPHAAQSLFD